MADANETTIRYEVWVRENAADGGLLRERLVEPVGGFLRRQSAAALVEGYTEDEIEDAAFEMRPVRKTYFVVKTTTTRERIR